jgi:glucosamine--fructose-6-phosphate aminotransferase (isomerizing)
MAGTGTSRHVAIAGKYMLEHLARVPVEVEHSSEVQHGTSIPTEDTLFVALSQSGETADTIAAQRVARLGGACTLAIANAPAATLMTEASARIHVKAGPELAVPSTKAFSAQLTAMYLLALSAAQARERISPPAAEGLMAELLHIPTKIEQVLSCERQCATLADGHARFARFLFAGRGIHTAVALDAALKVKETSYLAAEGMPAGEIWHGPLATIDEDMAVVLIVTRHEGDPESMARYEKTLANARALRGRAGSVIAVASHGDRYIAEAADHIIFVPSASELLLPLIEIVPLQLFAYYLATALGRDVDHPRNLSKSVLVERF